MHFDKDQLRLTIKKELGILTILTHPSPADGETVGSGHGGRGNKLPSNTQAAQPPVQWLGPANQHTPFIHRFEAVHVRVL